MVEVDVHIKFRVLSVFKFFQDLLSFFLIFCFILSRQELLAEFSPSQNRFLNFFGEKNHFFSDHVDDDAVSNFHQRHMNSLHLIDELCDTLEVLITPFVEICDELIHLLLRSRILENFIDLTDVEIFSDIS
jgi:hypothetical protein